MQYCELFLQELYAMLSYLLLNVTVENRIAKYFVLRHLLAELIAEFLSHLLWNKRDIDQLIWLHNLLLKFQLQAHVYFNLLFELGSHGIYLFFLVKHLGIE